MTDILHVCGISKPNLQLSPKTNLQAPMSRIAILLPGDGEVQAQGSLLQMKDLNYDTCWFAWR